MKPVRVGLIGLGVVGTGTYNVLKRNQAEIEGRVGRRIDITMVAVRDVTRAKTVLGNDTIVVTSDPYELINNPDIDVVLELIGGSTLAKDYVLAAINNGKHVVTANKALLANHGTQIFEAAERNNVMVAFEAAVAGGIPIIKSLREGLTANKIHHVIGIINGTTNFILSEMRRTGASFASVLQEAQRLGYAEADPTFDIEGVDAAHKLTIMAAIAFGIPVQLEKVYVEGITKLTTQDITYAEQMGYRIKLLGITRQTDAGIELRVHPTLVPSKQLIANVEGAMNAVEVQGDAVGTSLYYGKGAGAEPTASSVIADLIDIARLQSAGASHRVPSLAFHAKGMSNAPILKMKDVITSYYLRIHVADKKGVLAEITHILADNDISIGSLFQHTSNNADHNDRPAQTDLVILTHECIEHNMNTAITQIQLLQTVLMPIVRIRKEEFV
jgi:homoserine dehydrogenase